MDRIEKSAFRRGEYVGYAHGPWEIRKSNSSYGNWFAVKKDSPNDQLYAFTLADLNRKLAEWERAHPIARESNPDSSAYYVMMQAESKSGFGYVVVIGNTWDVMGEKSLATKFSKLDAEKFVSVQSPSRQSKLKIVPVRSARRSRSSNPARKPSSHRGHFATCRHCEVLTRKYEREGMSTSDAQGRAEAEHMRAMERGTGRTSNPARKPTIYEALRAKLGREPTNAELRADVDRIMREASEEMAQKGKLRHQRGRNPVPERPVGVKAHRGQWMLYKHTSSYHAMHGGRQESVSYRIAQVTSVKRDGKVKGFVAMGNNIEVKDIPAEIWLLPNERINLPAFERAASKQHEFDTFEEAREFVRGFMK